MIIWIMMIVVVSKPVFGPISISQHAMAFKTAERCFKSIPKIEEVIKKEYDEFNITCKERKLLE